MTFGLRVAVRKRKITLPFFYPTLLEFGQPRLRIEPATRKTRLRVDRYVTGVIYEYVK